MTMSNATHEESLLFQRLVQREETASSELFSLFYDDFFKYFRKPFNNQLNEDDLKDLIADSFFKFIDQPNKYDPTKGSLKKYLQADVRGDILNQLKKKSIRYVELDDDFRNSMVREDNPEIIFMNKELLEKVEAKLRDWFENEDDLKIAWNIVREVRETEHYSNILGLQNRPMNEQKKEVKRHKDRIKKQLERKGWEDFLIKLRNG